MAMPFNNYIPAEVSYFITGHVSTTVTASSSVITPLPTTMLGNIHAILHVPANTSRACTAPCQLPLPPPVSVPAFPWDSPHVCTIKGMCFAYTIHSGLSISTFLPLPSVLTGSFALILSIARHVVPSLYNASIHF